MSTFLFLGHVTALVLSRSNGQQNNNVNRFPSSFLPLFFTLPFLVSLFLFFCFLPSLSSHVDIDCLSSLLTIASFLQAQVIQLLAAALSIHAAAFDLAKNYGIVAWIHALCHNTWVTNFKLFRPPSFPEDNDALYSTKDRKLRLEMSGNSGQLADFVRPIFYSFY